ncbi:MAG: HAD family hydrolase [Pseudomonadota bacterium]|nr:HAD family hydrolase [Pseudomonadota bacterium]
MISWDEIDTVLLDMDGTLIDLNYDNTLWNEHLPRRYAAAHGLEPNEASALLYGTTMENLPKLHYYSVDYWKQRTQLDIDRLHSDLSHLIRYRPNADVFIKYLRKTGQRAVIATNAHPTSLAVKDAAIGLVRQVDACYSAHEFGWAKEELGFWEKLFSLEFLDRERTLLIDDNEDVLDTAIEFGVGHVLTIAQPDLQKPPRANTRYPVISDFADLMT